MRLELLDVNVDLVDFDLANVDVDVRVVARLPAFEPARVDLTCAAGSRSRLLARLSVDAAVSRASGRLFSHSCAPPRQWDELDARAELVFLVERRCELFWRLRFAVRLGCFCVAARARFSRSSGSSD